MASCAGVTFLPWAPAPLLRMRAPTVVNGLLLSVVAGASFGLVSIAARGSTIHPLVQSGSAYFLAGLALTPTLSTLRVAPRDWFLLLVVAVVGGAVAPAFLFFGLKQATAGAASVILTLEMVSTAVLAVIFLRERLRWREALAFVMLFAGSVLIATSQPADATGRTTIAGAALVAAAALGWGVDNTLSARLVGSYRPYHLVAVKGLVGGALALLAGLASSGGPAGTLSDAARIAFIGLVGICGSVVLFYFALQRIGATRTTAVFLPTSTLTGLLGAVVFRGEQTGPILGIASVLVVTGAILFATAGAEGGGGASGSSR